MNYAMKNVCFVADQLGPIDKDSLMYVDLVSIARTLSPDEGPIEIQRRLESCAQANRIRRSVEVQRAFTKGYKQEVS